MTCEEVLGLFRGAELSDAECNLLQDIFNQVLEEKGAVRALAKRTFAWHGEVDGLGFLDFMLVM